MWAGPDALLVLYVTYDGTQGDLTFPGTVTFASLQSPGTSLGNQDCW